MKKEKARCISNVPLITPAIEILERYEDHPTCIEKDVCLPLFCNQTMNSYLKQIATLCNIDKNLTTHVARHTLATMMLTLNVNLYTKTVGHADVKIMQCTPKSSTKRKTILLIWIRAVD